MKNDQGEEVGEVSIDEALRMALTVQRSGNLDLARAIFTRILDTVPEQPDALHFLGVLTFLEGHTEQAIPLIVRSVDLQPQQVDWRNNLGNVYLRSEQEAKAREMYRGVIRDAPDHANAWSNLGIAERLLKNPVAAEAAFREAIRIASEHADAHANFASFLFNNRRIAEAMEHLYKAISINPKHSSGSRILLSRAYLATGETDKAIDIFIEWEDETPDDPVPKHYLAALTGNNVPTRAADGYVSKVFDNFASTFDEQLARLDYRAPDIISAALRGALGERADRAALIGLDAGCGTGLCGPLVRGHFSRLEGVDLSPKMLEKASKRVDYDALHCAELTSFISAHARAYDVILSADTLCYFGRIDEVCAASAKALKPDGVLIFSLEEEKQAGGEGYRLQPHGRYCHEEAYVRQALAGAGATSILIQHDTLRYEAGMPVPGLIVTARF